MTTSIQRWIYVHEDNVPNALRALADAVAEVRPVNGEWLDDTPSMVMLQYDENTGETSAGICVSYRLEEEK